MANDHIGAAGEGVNMGAWRRQLASVAALAAAVLLIALVILVAASNRERDAALTRERHSYDVMVLARTLDASMARSEAALGRFVIDGNKDTGSLYYDEWRRAGRLLERLTRISRPNPEQAPLVDELNQLYIQRGKELAAPATRAYFHQGWPALSTFNDAGKTPTRARIAALMERIVANERAILGERSDTAVASAARSNFLAALLSATGILLVLSAGVLGWTTIRAVAERRLARRDADAEAERAWALEQAVADRTRELSEANERLRQEAIERAAAEAQLRQVQKMEAVGQLTGGIAHDFNNMLAVVVGGLDLARRRLSHEAQEIGRHIDNAMEGANRAAALTRRLLSFARAEPLMPKGIDPATLIAGMSDLLDRTLGERITVETRIEDQPWQVWCDPHQLENALLNLAVNARDAMEGEGTLRFATSNVLLADGQIGEAPAGDYVCIAVTDNGCGMTPNVVERAFEPFFTTKPVGKGTGLGLSQIFGFARQSEGEVTIRSAPGKGTTVSLYLPRFTHAMEAGRPPSSPAAHAPATIEDRAGAVVLVVEDDARVRVSTVNALEELGYAPLPCAGGEEAIALLAARDDVRLIVTDVVMPGMTGPEMVARIAPTHPRLAVLYVTGYAGDAGSAQEFTDHDVLRKPFTIAALEQAVAGALARAPRRTDEAA